MKTRGRLLQDCLSYFLRHGVANLSLRPLAAAVGTSARMLSHYFGSKEALIAEVMEQVQQRLQNSFRELLESERTKTKSGLLQEFWDVLSHRTNQPLLRLLFEVQMLALQDPRRYRRHPRRTSHASQRVRERPPPAQDKRAAAP